MSAPPRTSFVLRPRGPFSLEAVRTMACGFLRGPRACDAEGAVSLAFPHEKTFAPVAALLRMQGSDVRIELSQADPDGTIARQVERTLGLSQDGTGFAELLASDHVLSGLGRARPGFRPVAAPSPYAMAGWCVLSQRTPMARAASLQVGMARAFDDMAPALGERPALPSFPRPESLLSRETFPEIADEKWRRLQAIAAAALEGELDPEMLTSLPPREAMLRLQRIRGVGSWTAEAILIRGCGTTDLLPLGEPTLHAAAAAAYGLQGVPNEVELEHLARAWRPFRTWVSVLLIASFGRATSAKRGAPGVRTKRPTPAQQPTLPLFQAVHR